MAKRVTILDVAEEAGVSRQTVTRAMNGMPEISAQTRERVLAASQRLGYRPSRFARNLVNRQKTHALGLLVGSFRNPYYTDIAADFLTETQARGWQIIMAAPDPDDVATSIALLAAQVDVIVGHFGSDESLKAAAPGIPIVKLEEPAHLPGVHSVEINLADGIARAVDGLRERGCRKLAMIDSAYTARRGPYEPSPRRGYFEAAAGNDLVGVLVGDETITGGSEAFGRLMREHPDVDAVLVFNDLMALGVIAAAHGLGVRVPDDVRIMGIDGLALGEAVDPPLSTVSLDHEQLAREALDIVEEIAAAGFRTLPTIRRSLQPKLLWRGSA